MNTQVTTGRVVVGVDHSGSARPVLRFALQEAARRGATLEVVTAYQNPEHWTQAYGMPIPPTNEEFRDNLSTETQKLVDEVIGELAGDLANRPTVHVEARAGGAANVLLIAAAGADLLVVGQRGHGGFASMVLGSVSLQCVLHAPCAVTVVRPTEEQDGSERDDL